MRLPLGKSAAPLFSARHDVELVRRRLGRRVPRLRQFWSIKRILSPSERRIWNASIALFAISLAWMAVAQAGKFRVQVPKVSGEYTEGIVGALQTPNPLFAPLNAADSDIVSLVYTGLMRYDGYQRLVPDLADRYEVSEDKKTYTFFLKEGALWHDGEPVVAGDVVYTIQMIQDSAVGSPLIISFQGVSVEALDERTVRFILQESFPSFLSTLTVGILPEHLWGEVPPDRMKLAKGNLRPVGSGPFAFKRLLKDDTGFVYRYELERFPEYYGAPAYLKEFALQFFADYDTPDGAISALREQKIDGLNFVPLDLRDRAARKHIVLRTLRLPQYTALFFNQEKEPALENKNVREALRVALDKDRILREGLAGEGAVMHGPLLEGYPGYRNPEDGADRYSVEEANNLLDAAFPRISAEDYRAALVAKMLEERLKALQAAEPDGQEEEPAQTEREVSAQDRDRIAADINSELDTTLNAAQLFYRRRTKDGQDDSDILSLAVVTADTAEYRRVAQFVAGYWQEVGVHVSIDFVNIKEITRKVLKDRSYDILLYGMIVGSDPDQFPFWHSSQVNHPGLNLSRYINRKMDETLAAIRATDDEEKLAELYSEFERLIVTDIPAIFLYTPTYTYAQSTSIKGFDVDKISHPSHRFANVPQWYTDTKGQWGQE